MDNALAPLEFILRVATGLVVLVLLGTLTASISEHAIPGEGDAVCVTAPVHAISGASGQDLAGVRDSPEHASLLRRGVAASATSVELCDATPTRGQHLLSMLARMSPLLFFAGFLAATWMVTRTARRHGVFSPHLALAAGRLGIYLLLGEAVLVLVRMETRNRLMLSMAHTHVSNSWWAFIDISLPVLFAGFGLLTISRIMAQSVRMQREIDATV